MFAEYLERQRLCPLPSTRDLGLNPIHDIIDTLEMLVLKHEYGINMLATVVRASQCGIITEATQKNLIHTV